MDQWSTDEDGEPVACGGRSRGKEAGGPAQERQREEEPVRLAVEDEIAGSTRWRSHVCLSRLQGPASR